MYGSNSYGIVEYSGKKGGFINQSYFALQSLLEMVKVSPIALFADLVGHKASTFALYSKLEAKIWRKEYFSPSRIWIKEPTHE